MHIFVETLCLKTHQGHFYCCRGPEATKRLRPLLVTPDLGYGGPSVVLISHNNYKYKLIIRDFGDISVPVKSVKTPRVRAPALYPLNPA